MQALFVLYMHLYNKYGDFATAYYKMTETIRSRFDGINSVSTRQKLDTNYQFILQLTDQSVRTLTLMFLRVGWTQRSGTPRMVSSGDVEQMRTLGISFVATVMHQGELTGKL